MENQPLSSGTNLSENQENALPLTVSPQAAKHLMETAKWGRFLAIAGFCFVGILVLMALFATSILSSFTDVPGASAGIPGFIMGLFYLLGAALYFFPLYYLFNFATHIKNAFLQGNAHALNTAFKNLEAHYKYLGIFTVIVIGFYLLIGAGVLIFGIFATF